MTNSVDQYIDKIGPVWTKAEDGNYAIPERTLGWACVAWVLEHLTNGEKGEDAGPFMLTPEQGRFILWWYAIDESGDFLYNEGQLQRLKGWGKDPLVCIISLFEALGPCRFDGWTDDSKTIARTKEQVLPLIQIAATTQEQTDSTMRLYKHYLHDDTVRKFKIEINTETVKTHGVVVIRSITSNPEALEGKSPTFVIVNEPHHWHSNTAMEMWKVIARNAVKVKGGTSRILSITNAYDPNLGSVAQETRETYELQISKMGTSKILYDSIEVLPDAPLYVYQDDNDESNGIIDMDATRENIAALIDCARGDSKWSKLDRIVDEFFDTRYPPDLNRRFWLNTIVSSEESWIDVRDFDKSVWNSQKTDIFNGDMITMFFDGSKSNDSTVLVGCRVSDGYIFKIASWHKPKKNSGPEGTVWLVPRNERDKKRFDFDDSRYYNPYKNIETVDEAVDRAFRDYNVVGFFADPSHAKDEVTNKMYWDEAIEKWHIKYSKQLKTWAGNRSGSKSESINWDMQNSFRIEEFAGFAERISDMVMRNELLISDDTDFRSHFKNAKVYKTKSGLESIWKGRRNSEHKIDLAVGAIGAYLVRSKYMKEFGEKKNTYNSLHRFA